LLNLYFADWESTVPTVKMMIEISTKQYDRLLSVVPAESSVYAMLKNGVIVDHSKASLERKSVSILCAVEQARGLLDAARQLCPEAVPEIEDGLVNPRPFEP
jgi:hypothetical protein